MGAAAMIGGTLLGMAAQYRQGNYDQQMALNNAMLTEYQRRDTLSRGGAEAGRVYAEGKNVGSEARAEIAAGNVDGPSLDTAVLQSRYNAALDAARLRANAAREAWGYANQAQDLRAQARESKRAGILGAFGTGLSGAGQAYASYQAGKATKAGA